MNPAERAEKLLDVRLADSRPVAGGDLSAVFEIRLEDGRVLIAKGGPAPAIEAAMLDAIRAKGVAAPEVVAHDESVLVIERLPAGGGIESAWRHLGRQLSRLHAVDESGIGRQACYGWQDSYAFGRVPIDNGWSGDWPGFWAERRLAILLSGLPRTLASRAERLAARLPDLLPATPRPSLLHGDLWVGNILVADGRISGLIDPACYFGDREVDFAMLRLFGRPGPELMEECEALATGHERRRPIYQLWPALVHVRLFGAGYHGMVDRLLGLAGF